MGNTQPTNKTGRKVTAQKLENAKKIGVLSLSEHSLETIPRELYQPEIVQKVRTLDLSKNNLQQLGIQFSTLNELKNLNLDYNQLQSGSLSVISKLNKLQNLSVANNKLGKPHIQDNNHKRQQRQQQQNQDDALPNILPGSIKQINISSNFLSNVPKVIVQPNMLLKLEKLDLSYNQLATVPEEIYNVINLQELKLDNNMIVSLPETVGKLLKLKALSLRNNQLSVSSTVFNDTTNIQPIPKLIFTDTSLIDLNLHGNNMTNTQLNEFDGYKQFLERRQKVKSKHMTNLDVCGLD